MDWLAAISQSHRQPLLFDVKYPLTSKNSPPIVPAIESNALSNKPVPPFDGVATGITGQNLPARIRGTMLMTISNKLGHLLLSTGNKSELAVGFEPSIVNDIIARVDRNQHKRCQSPPGLKATTKFFGYGRKYPIAQRYRSQ